MGIWDYLSSTADSVRQCTVTPVKNLCTAAVTNAGKVRSFLPEEETMSVMYEFATTCAKNAAIFACLRRLKGFPGGSSIIDIISRSFHETNRSKLKPEEVKALRAQLKDLKERVEKMQVGLEEQMKEIQEVTALRAESKDLKEMVEKMQVGLQEQMKEMKEVKAAGEVKANEDRIKGPQRNGR